MFRGNVNCHSYLCCGTNHACIIPIPWLENVDQVHVINSAITFSKASFLWSDEWCLVMVSFIFLAVRIASFLAVFTFRIRQRFLDETFHFSRIRRWPFPESLQTIARIAFLSSPKSSFGISYSSTSFEAVLALALASMALAYWHTLLTLRIRLQYSFLSIFGVLQ